MNNSSAAVAGQMSLVFAVLKIAGQIDWPWVWVLSPAWIFFALTFTVGLVVGLYRGLKIRIVNSE